MNSKILEKILLDNPRLQVLHLDCEYGISDAKVTLVKVVKSIDYGNDDGSLRELNYFDSFNDSNIEMIRRDILEFADRNLIEEYAQDPKHNTLMGWTEESYVLMFQNEQKRKIEMLRRIEEAEYSILISGT